MKIVQNTNRQKNFFVSLLQNPFMVLGICFLIPTVFFAVNALSSLQMHPIKIEGAQLDSAENVWFILNVIPGSKTLKFTGWASLRGVSNNRYNWETPSYNTQEAVYSNNRVVLRDRQGRIFTLKTYSIPDPAISIRVDDVRTHDNDGFVARIFRGDLKEGEIYTVGVLMTKLNGRQLLVFSKNEITR